MSMIDEIAIDSCLWPHFFTFSESLELIENIREKPLKPLKLFDIVALHGGGRWFESTRVYQFYDKSAKYSLFGAFYRYRY